MQVIDGLSRQCVGIGYQAVTIFRHPISSREQRGGPYESADESIVCGRNLERVCDVSARYEQEVKRRLRVQILEGQDLPVVVEDGGRGAPCRYLAEDAI